MIAVVIMPWLAAISGVALAASNFDVNGWLLSSEVLGTLASAIASLLIGLFSALFFGTPAGA